MIIAIGMLVYDSMKHIGWISAEHWGLVFFIVYLFYTAITFDKVYQLLCIFSIIAGFTELLADHYLVAYTNTLVYPLKEPALWSSPYYMPFSWAVVLIQIGYLGWLISKKTGVLISGLIMIAVSAVIIPLYESWAIKAGWWDYQHCKTWKSVPYYIFIAEGLLMFTVPWFLSKAENKNMVTIAGYGILQGLVMLFACIIAILITG
ncbi:DUF6989 domain-containing protein [Mucilaginibacter arboris]|uniref:DUF6989 domain-containing protein n=1 Tax=Mucilaginibacter arboris TaxID=2682090 RepID=A0A7K1SV36_9SPHI|nr:hypothetical protein [Mucilaginibacter arboris]MVN21209.1 hypothetical protein [Mucilaginibacter arboris]